MSKGDKNAMEVITVLLVDDHKIFRQGLRALLKEEKDIRVVGEAGTGAEAVQLAEKLVPSVIVMDITMPDFSGLHAAHRLLDRNPGMKVIVLSMTGEEEFVRQAISAGVRGYLIKQTAASELISAIRQVSKGNAVYSPPISRLIEATPRVKPKKKPVQLTLREREILQLVAMGKTSNEIGATLCISTKTVHKHRQQLMERLGLHNAASLIRYAISKGIIK